MTDIATTWDAGRGLADWRRSLPSQVVWTDEHGNSIVDQAGRPVSTQFTPGEGLAIGDDLLTAVLISIFTDAEAGVDDAIADGSDDPRGWWAGPIGSKIWLRTRSKATPLTLALVKSDIEQALAWLIEDDVAASIDVETEWTRPGLLGARVEFRRNDGTRRAFAFGRVWENA